MARLFGPDEASRLVYTRDGRARAQGLTAPIYADAAATVLADILTEAGAAIADSEVTVDDYSRIPIIQYPDGVDTVYTRVAGGPVVPLYARTDDRLDELATAVTAAQADADTAQATATTAQTTATAAQVAATAAQAAADDATVDVAAVDARVDTVAADVATVDARVDTATADLAALDGRVDTLEGQVGGLRPLAHSGYSYTIVKTVEGSTNRYTALNADGSTAATSTDSASPLRSGLRTVLVAVAANDTSIYFPAGMYTFPEDPAGVEDHWAPNGITGFALEGDPSGGTIVANWRDDSQSGYSTTPDTEPFSFTRCHRLRYRNITIWAGGNIDANNSSDAVDMDGCHGVFVEGLRIERSRARGLVYDGGDSGADSRHSHVVGCEIWGVPRSPSVSAGSAASVTAQEYAYAVTYVDSVLGETPPSEPTSYTASGSAAMRLLLPTGPAYSATQGVTARKIYRWSTAQPSWRLLTTIADNTTTQYDDSATDASIAAAATVPTTATPLIPAEGIKLLGSRASLVTGCEVVGVGSHGIQAVRKGTDASSNVGSDQHRIIGNTIRRAGAGTGTAAKAGVYIGGGSHLVVQGNSISNVGMPAAQGYAVYVQGLTGATTEGNTLGPNTIYDDQTADSPSGGASTKYGIQINTTGGGTDPDGTVIVPGATQGMVTADVNDVTGTNTKQFADTTHTHAPEGGSGPAPVVPGWKAGNYYGARSSMAYGSLSGQALSANQAYAAPMYVPADKTVTTIACSVTTAVALAKLRMGIYTIGSDGRPDALVAGSETGDISAATTGDKTGVISAALSGGQWYWLTVASDQAISVNGFTAGQPNLLGSAGPGSSTKASGVRVSIGSGWTSLPSTFPSPSDTAITLTVEVSF